MATVNKKAGGKWKETRHDKYYHLAKEQGYRSRAAFKLIQINKKYNLLSNCKSCLDLCAAPGGWLQVANKYMPVSSMLIGVDILPIRPLKGAVCLQADITTAQVKTLIKKELNGWDCDVILHDGAPNVAGGQVWSKDAYQQVELVIYSLRLVTMFLRAGGTFVTKVFRSQDYNALLWVLQQFFQRVEICKPAASRAASAEIFVVCLNYKKPKKVDPALLDPNVIFQNYAEKAKKPDVFKTKEKAKGIRSREGYDTDKQVLFETTEASEFISSNNEQAIDMLGKYNQFTFQSEESKYFLTLKESTEEILNLCQDLKVLGKGDFKQLMNWRKKLKQNQDKIKLEAEKEAKNNNKLENQEEIKELTEEEKAQLEEEKLNAELEQFKIKQTHEKRKEKRKKRELKTKQQQKLLLNQNNYSNSNELIVNTQEEGLFSLNSIPDQNTLDNLESRAEMVNMDEIEASDEEGGINLESKKFAGNMKIKPLNERYAEVDSNDDDENMDYYDRVEADLDRAYEDYKVRKKIHARKYQSDNEIGIQQDEDELNNKQLFALDNETQELGSEDDIEAALEEEEEETERKEQKKKANGKSKKRKANELSEEDDDNEEEREGKNPLLNDLGGLDPISAETRAKRWFDRDLFKSMEMDLLQNGNGKSSSHSSSQQGNSKKAAMNALFDSYQDESSDEEEEEDNEENNNENMDISEDEDEKQAQEEQKYIKELRSDRLSGLDSMTKSASKLQQEKVNVKKQAKIQAKNERRAAGRIIPVEKEEEREEGDFSRTFDSEGDAHMIVDLDSKKKAKKFERLARKRELSEKGGDSSNEQGHGDFEEVKAAESELSDYSDDIDSKASILAMGTAMLDKRRREELMDNSYNRYSFDLAEVSQLPEWFQVDESNHNQASLPVTAEEMNTFKSKLKAINARPIKKIAEARARKAEKTAARWEKIKQKAEAIAKDEGANEASKMREIEKLYHKKAKTEKRERKYVVSKKGGGTAINNKKGGGQVVRVDGRMKKDKRGTKNSDKRSKKSKSTMNKRRKKQ